MVIAFVIFCAFAIFRVKYQACAAKVGLSVRTNATKRNVTCDPLFRRSRRARMRIGSYDVYQLRIRREAYWTSSCRCSRFPRSHLLLRPRRGAFLVFDPYWFVPFSPPLQEGSVSDRFLKRIALSSESSSDSSTRCVRVYGKCPNHLPKS